MAEQQLNNNASSQSMIRVLLVEDHLLTRIGLKTVLERTADIRVIAEAENGEEAVRQAFAITPDVILMDVGMPIMDGIEAAKKICEGNKDIPIIMLTSHDNEQDIFASLSAGASGYCLKDVEPERLYSAVRSVKAGDIWLDAAIASKVLSRHSTSAQDSAAQTFAAGSLGGQIKQPAAGAAYPNLPDPLSPRELEVLNLLVDGLSNQEIADRLFISLAAKTHVRNILNKLAVDDRTQAAVHAMRRGLV